MDRDLDKPMFHGPVSLCGFNKVSEGNTGHRCASLRGLACPVQRAASMVLLMGFASC